MYAQEEACGRDEMIYNKPNERPLKEMIETSSMTVAKVETKDSPLNPMATEWPEKMQDNSTLLKSPKKELDKSFIKQDSFVKIITIQDRQTKCIEELVAQQQISALTLILPKPEVPVFSGDPIGVLQIMRAFETLIEARTNSNSARLCYLVQYTSGAVQELMQSCSLTNPGVGYWEAKKLLRNHATLLNFQPSSTNDARSDDINQRSITQVNNGFVETKKASHNYCGSNTSKIRLAVVPLKVRAEGQNNALITYAFLDGGSNSTFCTEALLKQLDLQGKNTEFVLNNYRKRR